MDANRRAEIEKMLEAITPGPWQINQHREVCTDVWLLTGAPDELGEPRIVFDCSWEDYEGGGWPPNDADAAFITQSPTIIRELLAEVVKLEQEIEKLGGATNTPSPT